MYMRHMIVTVTALYTSIHHNKIHTSGQQNMYKHKFMHVSETMLT